MITMRQIEAFHTTMTTGSATEAAKVIGVSQPAVSRMLADLEKMLQLKLFQRANRQLLPTPEGQLLFEEIEHVFFGLQRIMNSANNIKSLKQGQLRIITIPSMVPTLVVEAVRLFSRAYPDISVSLEVQPPPHVFEWIVGRQCDIGISTMPSDNPAINSTIIGQANAVCIMPRGDSLSHRKIIRAKDLKAASLVSFKSWSVFQHRVDEVFRREGMVNSGKIEGRSTEAVYGLVAAGLGVAVVPPIFHKGLIHPNIVVRPFLPEISVDVAILLPSDRPVSLAAEKFISFVKESLDPQVKTDPSPLVLPE